jgi:hypothetical protein
MRPKRFLVVGVLGILGFVGVAGAADPTAPPPDAVSVTPERLDALTPKISTKDGHPDPTLLCIASSLYDGHEELAPLRGLIPLTAIELASPPRKMADLFRRPTAPERQAIAQFSKLMTGCLEAGNYVAKLAQDRSADTLMNERDGLMAQVSLKELYEGRSSYATYTARVSLLRMSLGSR